MAALPKMAQKNVNRLSKFFHFAIHSIRKTVLFYPVIFRDSEKYDSSHNFGFTNEDATTT